uniref:Uncharacterized protein n=1 Tax=Rhizophora mucronata TaxID=61149 RepID=A0A2P2K2D9_RHIMU
MVIITFARPPPQQIVPFSEVLTTLCGSLMGSK